MNFIFIKENHSISLSKIVLIVGLFLLSLCTSSFAQDLRTFLSDGKNINVADFDAEINKMLIESKIPGLSLAVFEDNKVVYSNSYGFKDIAHKKSVNSKTIFEAASLSKVFLSIIAHQLVEKGKLDLNKPMYQYLPWPALQHDERYKLITAKMILSHCSGVENWTSDNNKDVLEILENPGERFVYSGEGYQYLAAVIETILNEPYDHYVSRMIIKPLKLKRTFVKYRKPKINIFEAGATGNYAVGHGNFGESLEKWKNSKSVPASGIHTTAADYANFFVSTFNKQYLSENRYKDFFNPVVMLSEDSTLSMGPGLGLICTKADTIVGFSGSNGGFKAQVFYSPISKKGFVFLTNSDRGNMLITKLNTMTVNLDINFIFNGAIQYPNAAISVLNAYENNNADAMIEEIGKLKGEGKLDINYLGELAEMFRYKDEALSQKISSLAKSN